MDDRSLAEQKCVQRARNFEELFRNQYVISRQGNREYPGWRKLKLHEWTLHHGWAVRVSRICDAKGYLVGYLIGHALSPGGEVVRDELRVSFDAMSPEFGHQFDAVISELAGRYLAVIDTPKFSRVYGDPVSDIPILFDASTQRVASSLGLILDRPIEPDQRFHAHRILSGRENLSLQFTLDANVRRSISNHYLDLSGFTLTRFWPSPKTQFEIGEKDLPLVAKKIADRLAENMAGLIRNFRCSLPVTGGRDSRMLLAAALPVSTSVHQFLCHRFHNPSRSDAVTALKVLSSVDLTLTQYFKKKATQTEVRDMRLKMGWTGYRGELKALAIMNEYPRDDLILRGNILELLRANQWRRDKIGQPVHVVHGLRRLGISASLGHLNSARIWSKRYEDWVESLPEAARGRVYDFGFLEWSLPNYQGAYLNGFNQFTMINPANDRAIIELAASVPVEQRLNGNLVREVIRSAHAPFLEIPFN